MKKIIIMVLFLTSTLLYSQENYPYQAKFWIYPDTNSINKDSVLLSPNMNRFRLDNQYILGWHWGHTRRVTETMKFNYVDCHYHTPLVDLPSNSNLYYFAQNVSCNTIGANILQSMGIEYSAINHANDTSNSKIILGSNRHAFGFKTINGVINSDGWLYLNNQHANSIVLKNNTPNNCLSSNIGISDDEMKYFGKKFIFGITLKRSNGDINLDTMPILKIKLPYWIGSTRYIMKINRKASNNLNDTINIVNSGIYRGTILSDSIPANNDSIITIRRNMLPLNNRPIQILCSFLFGDPDLYNNPLLYNNSKVEIEVEYLGNLEIGIKNLTIETPAARELVWGYKDQEIIKYVQKAFDVMETPEVRNRKIYIKRFYTRDEGNESFWRTYWYFNNLVGKIGIVETDYDNYNEGIAYTNNNDYWIGRYKSLGNRSRPFMKGYDYSDAMTEKFRLMSRIGIDRGYDYCSDLNPTKEDSLRFIMNSGYEIYRKRIIEGGTTRWILPEWTFQNNFIDPIKQYMDVNKGAHLFSDKPWWVQTFFDLWQKTSDDENRIWILAKNNYHAVNHWSNAQNRITGEEVRAFFWHSLILGAKGFLSDGVDSYVFNSKHYNGYLKCTIGDNGLKWLRDSLGINLIDSNLTDEQFIRSELLGTDFLFPDSLLKYEYTRINDFLDKDSVLKYQRINNLSRLYLGRKSTRLELFKLSKLIRANENELLNLKLQAWLTKGYTKEYKQHPKYSYNIISKFIDTNRINLATKPIGRTKIIPKTNKIVDYWENEASTNDVNLDSCFYDLSLLSTDSDTLMNRCFYIGILNRRTDPIIIFNEENNNEILFLSTAELEEFCMKDSSCHPITGKKYSKNIWKKYLWKRLGCREIKIPLKINNADLGRDFLKITEIGANNDELNKDVWRTNEFYHRIDTSMFCDGILRIKLQPGEGKILKIEIVKCQSEFVGKLDHSNQRKIVAFPTTGNFNPLEGLNEVRYHMVYVIHEQFPPQSNIYYRRSQPVSSNFSANSDNCIPWESAKLISKNVNILNSSCNSILTFNPNVSICPSIVVRKGANGEPDKVHIVYQTYHPENSRTGCIVEHVFNAEEEQLNYDNGNTLAMFSIPDRSYPPNSDYRFNTFPKWGTPMINSSEGCNYYTWSDSLSGIGIAYKNANEICLNSSKYISYYLSDSAGYKPYARHPSLNTYSPTKVIDPNISESRAGDYDCALVWQETNIGPLSSDRAKDSTSQIYYTRLLKDSNNVFNNYLPNIYCNDWYQSYSLNNLRDIACISKYNGRIQEASFNKYPAIYRNIDIYSKEQVGSGYTPPHTYHEDFVYWEGQDEYFRKKAIIYQSIGNLDQWVPEEYNGPLCWDVRGALEIASTSFDLSKPSASHGIIREYFVNNKKYYTGLTDSSNLVNFICNNFIFQVRHGYYSLMSDWQSLLGDFMTYKYTRSLRGLDFSHLGIEMYENNYVHLMASPYIRKNNDANLSRRLINISAELIDSPGTYVELINPSVAYLFKTNDEIKYYQIPTFGFRNDSLTYFISPIVISRNYDIVMPRLGFDSTKTKIVSDWFNIVDSDEFTFLSSSKKNIVPYGEIYIEKKDNGFVKKIPLITANLDGKHKKHNYKFINTQNSMYRFVWDSKLTPQHYSEILFIEPENDELNIFKCKEDKYKKSNEYQIDNVIDLCEFDNKATNQILDLLINPNPANDIVALTPYKTYNINNYHDLSKVRVVIEISTLVGNSLAIINTSLGSTIRYNISNFSNGYYYIKASYYNENNEIIETTTKQLIICR